ncbi:TIR domain-containing protein [Erythrobacter sp. SCSIO 43205]|uniref:TIR domain-containing protein n=1 Tax=Erythrobacter sp. SCSIO 43205 TaxID=2779361 RepID=UPI001CAA1293|nr:TIR domain-containing protein [Erythrobacter sp. SCSIO 43205]UAB79075.1 TIR domain-containing protein [Erythrobacter sp. SCSIO 43205]
MDIFISYSRRDRERVNFMAKALEAEGYSVWWDRDLRAGEEFDNVIDKHIKQSKAIVVVWSNTSIKSNWVKEEAEDGVIDNKLVPVLIDDVVIPRGFRRIQAAELQDSSADPTKSKNWRVFLESIRTIAGEGEGTEAGAAQMAQFGLATEDQGAGLPETANTADTPFWKRPIGMVAAALALLIVGMLALQLTGFGGGSSNGRLAGVPEDKAIVLGIYPNESFGIQQSNGLKASLEGFPQLMVQDLDAPLDAMKTREAPDVIENLRAFLEERNVVAVIGPSITEFTPQVLDVIEESGKRPAIILTTAGSRADLGWKDSDLPIFRVGSGVDERASQFKVLAERAIAQGIDITFMLETVEGGGDDTKTYGELFFNRITEELGEDTLNGWQEDGRVEVREYERGSINDAFATPEGQAILGETRLIVIMGLSNDFKDLARGQFGADKPQRKAMLASWNNSHHTYALNELSPLQTDRLIDITDVFAAASYSGEQPEEIAQFESLFGPISPRWRLEAVAFDSGVIVKQAAAEIEGEITADALVATLRSRSFNGVTGRIFFNSTGQNTGDAGGLQRFYNVSYDPANNGWREVNNLASLKR